MDKKQRQEALRNLLPNTRVKDRAYRLMTLGSMIKALSKEKTQLPVYIGDGTVCGYPGQPHSYYGYPSDLAFTISADPITVEQFAQVCEDCMGKAFSAAEDLPGVMQDYTMFVNTPLWISEIRTASKTGIIDVVYHFITQEDKEFITLVTETIQNKVEVSKEQ